MEYSIVTVHPDSLSAEMARGILLDCGLNPLTIPTSSHGVIMGAELGHWVYVPDHELEAARSALVDTPFEKALWNVLGQ